MAIGRTQGVPNLSPCTLHSDNLREHASLAGRPDVNPIMEKKPNTIQNEPWCVCDCVLSGYNYFCCFCMPLPASLSLCLSVSSSTYLSISLSACLPAFLPLFVFLWMSASISLSVSLLDCICLSVFIILSARLSVCLCLSLSLSLRMLEKNLQQITKPVESFTLGNV